MTDDTLTTLEACRVVYLGRRQGTDSKLREVWITESLLENTLDPQELERRGSWFEKPKRASTPGIIGGIYTMNVDVDAAGRIKKASVSQRQFVQMLESDERAVWHTADKLASATVRQAALLKRMAGNSDLEAALNPLRVIYQKLSYAERFAFKMMVIDSLGKQPS